MLCAIAKIDEASTAALQSLQTAAVRHGAPPKQIHGHITLASYIGEDDPGFLAHCKSILRDMSAFSVVYETLAVLAETNIIVASPSKTDALLKLHCCLGDGYWASLDHWSQEDVWQPHTTLVYDPAGDLEQLCGLMCRAFSPITAQVTQVEFSRVAADGYEILDNIDLKPTENEEKSNGNKARRHHPAGLPGIRHCR